MAELEGFCAGVLVPVLNVLQTIALAYIAAKFATAPRPPTGRGGDPS